MNTSYDPEKVKLDAEEQMVEDSFTDYGPVDLEARNSLMAAAKKAPRILREKKQMVSIRLDPQDIALIKEKALRAGLAYQTMVAALLHQYAKGDLVNIEEARKILRL